MEKLTEENLSIERAFDLAAQHHQKGNFQKAEILYRKILEKNPKHYQSLGNLGLLAMQFKKHDISKGLFIKAIQINPRCADAHNNLGNVLNYLGEDQKAIACYQKAVEYDPENLTCVYHLSLLKKWWVESVKK